MPNYTIGLDFGTESGRALLVDATTGREVAGAVCRYACGVIDEALPGTDEKLPPDWALQNPADYLVAMEQVITQVIANSGVDPSEIIGIGLCFTACTILPVAVDATPLSESSQWCTNPHAWTKLWKHHAATEQAERITSLASMRNEPWLARYGGRISSEWMHSKALQVLDEAPEVYAAADQFVEAGDWVVWQLTGARCRNATAAGYKALWSRTAGFPSREFLYALDPRFEAFHETKLRGEILPPGTKAGGLTEEWASRLGLRAELPVAVGTIDAHASVSGAGVGIPGSMILILGTSTCHMLLGHTGPLVRGISGVVEDGIIPGFYGYEAGQAAVGDIFEWFVQHAVPESLAAKAEGLGVSLFELLEGEASALRAGESGILALDWWNGNRSVLVDAGLSGLLIGATLSTRPHEIYRALIEATAFGTRIIIEAFEEAGIAVRELVVCGGLAERNKLLLQIYADVTGRELKIADSGFPTALGASMLGAVAAGSESGGYASLTDASLAMSPRYKEVYSPDADNHLVYEKLYREYRKLHDYFGRGENNVMKRLREIRANVPSL